MFSKIENFVLFVGSLLFGRNRARGTNILATAMCFENQLSEAYGCSHPSGNPFGLLLYCDAAALLFMSEVVPLVWVNIWAKHNSLMNVHKITESLFTRRRSVLVPACLFSHYLQSLYRES